MAAGLAENSDCHILGCKFVPKSRGGGSISLHFDGNNHFVLPSGPRELHTKMELYDHKLVIQMLQISDFGTADLSKAFKAQVHLQEGPRIFSVEINCVCTSK